MKSETNELDPLAAPTEEELTIVRLLAEGLKDEVIARRLGLAKRTYSRRLDGVWAKLGASSRFQAGVLAVTRGWIGASADPPHATSERSTR